MRCIQVDAREFNRHRLAKNDLSGQRSIIMVVAGKMFVVGAGMIASGARRAMAGGFNMQKTYRYFMSKRNPRLFNLMGNRKDGIDGKTGNHRYQSQSYNFFITPIQPFMILCLLISSRIH
ncbi:MAG: hypothetical protein A2076_02440 [Geobacteraceae bacterium GWC2_53_11]|nr:MAG: hypothetical protein A2076_02440 [Geobacteraceae bacterium GWC2_53_11]